MEKYELEYVAETKDKKPELINKNFNVDYNIGLLENLFNWQKRFSKWLSARLEKAEEANKEAVEIIQWLRDLQNGCPLPKYEKDFNEQNARADKFLKLNQEK